jgi:minor extracellular serine protease Vpr
LRRAIPLLAALVAALMALSGTSSAVAHTRVRHGTIPKTTTRVRVVVALQQPPLALRGGRGLAFARARTKLDVRSATARAYVASLVQAQARAASRLRAAIPSARVGRRFQVVLDALTVSLPARQLPALLRQRWAVHVYPSLQYRLATDRSPSVIGADVLRRTTGADGTGVKIAIVDDGVDQTNPFFAPNGLEYPSGFPKGVGGATTPKVIAARVFAGPNAGKAGRLPVDPASSFHGTHVAGIAAGDSGTTAPAGADHPRVTGLSGVAPHAWLGNYRVFTVPTPIGHVANTPEIVAAFEAAVKDGMDVVNFSGGGPEVEPSNDALIAAVHAVAAAGVVPVIAAGNDRDDYGIGSVGSPGTAADAISVAAVSDTHVFGSRLTVPADASIAIPFSGANGERPPTAWGSADHTLVDVGTITGTDGKPVERHLCGPPGALDTPRGTLPGGSLANAIALVDRGLCPFVEKAQQARAAGAVGIVFVENREGEATPAPTAMPIAAGTVANADGRRLRALAETRGGRIAIRVERGPFEIETGRSGVVTSFSSAGPTPFRHVLKPDVSAPGGQILSATLANTDSSRFAVFDGTSMATPHVSGAAALLLQLHRSWTPAQVKSALMSTAAPAWGDTARTREAPVPLEGAGLVALAAADSPQIFIEPASLSFRDLAPGSTRTLVIHVSDADGGAGTWTAAVSPQSATTGVVVTVSPLADLAPGASTDLTVTAAVAADAPAGDDFGFIVLTRGAAIRRIPYFFLVDRPALAAARTLPLRRLQHGDTRTGANHVSVYRYPSAPFGNQPDAPTMSEDGAEVVYSTTLPRDVVNAGVVVVDRSSGAQIDPWYLGAKDENDVQGFAGTPVDVNELTFDYGNDVGAAGASFPAAGTYFASVDSGRAPFTNRRLAGRFTLRAWVNDVTPPSLELLTRRVTAGRPTLVFRSLDGQSGVDPASLTVAYAGALVSVGRYQRSTGLAFFPLPGDVDALRAGTVRLRMMSSDFQETKNVDTMGSSIMPNTRTRGAPLHVVAGVTVDWLLPTSSACRGRRLFEVIAGSPASVRVVRFSVDGRRVATDRAGSQGAWTARVRLPHGRHTLTATAVDGRGHTASATRIVRACSA